MLKFYYNGSPNPTKVALFLEEAGLAYEPIPIDTRKGDQFKGEFLSTIPTARSPPLSTAMSASSTAMQFFSISPKDRQVSTRGHRKGARRTALLADVRRHGVGPFSGQAVHFRHFAPVARALCRQSLQLRSRAPLRHSRSAPRQQPYMLGETYTIVDMNVWGWTRLGPFVLGEEGAQRFANLKR
jgi:GST-like protein